MLPLDILSYVIMGSSLGLSVISCLIRIMIVTYEAEVQRGVQQHYHRAEIYRQLHDNDEQDYKPHTGNYTPDDLSSDEE